MPPSRIAYALADVADEARKLRRDVDGLQIEVWLDSVTFEATWREVADYYASARAFVGPAGLSAMDEFEANGIKYRRIRAAKPGRQMLTGGSIDIYPEAGYSFGEENSG